jgi:hypothetical protein
MLCFHAKHSYAFLVLDIHIQLLTWGHLLPVMQTFCTYPPVCTGTGHPLLLLVALALHEAAWFNISCLQDSAKVLLPADLPHPGPMVSHDTSAAAETASTRIIHVKPVTLYRTELTSGATTAAAAAPAGPPEDTTAASVTPLSADMANLNLQQQQHVHHPASIAPAAEAAAAAAFPTSSSTTSSSSHGHASRVHPVSADDNVYSLPVPAAGDGAAPVPAAVLAGSAAAEPEPGHRLAVVKLPNSFIPPGLAWSGNI